jgi:hypothetical protein
MADSPLAGFYHHTEYQSFFWTNFWTYVMFSASLGSCLLACFYAFWARKEGEYDLEGSMKEMLVRMGLYKIDDTDKRSAHLARQGSVGSDDSKEKPLISYDEDRFV